MHSADIGVYSDGINHHHIDGPDQVIHGVGKCQGRCA